MKHMKGVIFIGKIHLLKITPGTEEESNFITALGDVGVKQQSVICRQGLIFNKPYDEYLISNGLYKQLYNYEY